MNRNKVHIPITSFLIVAVFLVVGCTGKYTGPRRFNGEFNQSQHANTSPTPGQSTTANHQAIQSVKTQTESSTSSNKINWKPPEGMTSEDLTQLEGTRLTKNGTVYIIRRAGNGLWYLERDTTAADALPVLSEPAPTPNAKYQLLIDGFAYLSDAVIWLTNMNPYGKIAAMVALEIGKYYLKKHFHISGAFDASPAVKPTVNP